MNVLLLLVALCADPAVAAAESLQDAELVEVRKIWDRAPHNAFTDLVRFKDRWYCVFREGASHVSPDGALRVIASADGATWESKALLRSATADLRDPKIVVTPDGRLMLNGAAALHQPAEARHQSLVWFSNDGHQWTDANPVAHPDTWLWRVTWHKNSAYGVGYRTTGERFIRLYGSTDGIEFDTLVDPLFERGYPNEATLVFLENDKCLCLLRRDGDSPSAQLGIATPPYREWAWKDLEKRIGGPNFIRLPDGRLIAGVRLYDGAARTALCWLDAEAGTLTEILTLPSGGDTSYPGLVWHEGLLCVSYYSSHEGRTSIYLAKVRLPQE